MKNKKVKIVATLGPASQSPDKIESLAKAGVDVIRLNLSHQQKDSIRQIVKDIREIEKKLNKPLSVMGDLGGLKVRIGKVEDNTVLNIGQEIKISSKSLIGTQESFSINHSSVLNQLKKGSEILIDDGTIKLKVTQELKDELVYAKVEVGGLLLSNKGFYSKDITFSSIGVPQKDIDDIKLMEEVGADALAVSFVQSQQDVMHIKNLLSKDSDIVLIAKIETAQSVENIEKIIDISDGIMIARGDLGLDVPIAQVPILQKKLIALCLEKAKPVITATQMLDSMTQNPFPTRAEVADVANAILDGTDAVMLSDETASGAYPLEAVEMMAKVIETTTPSIESRQFSDITAIPHSVSSAAGLIALQVGARLIIAFTQGGFSALQIARNRYPQEVIVGLSPNKKTLKFLNFCWGVYPYHVSATQSFDHALEQTKEFIKNNDIIKLQKGEPYVVVTGLPFNKPNVTNLIHVFRAE